MKKRKTYEISVIDKTYSKIISDETKFYTSDTALELAFELKETEYNFESAEIVLLNVDDRSLATRPVSKVNNDFVYEIDDDITSHYGDWRGQLMLVEKGEVHVSSPIKFRIENDLYCNKPLEITEVVSWISLKQYANGLIDELKQAVLSIEGIDDAFNTNEVVRQNTFVTAEQSRQTTFETNETGRQSAEQGRIEAENLRVEGYQEVRNFIDNFEIGENAVGTENIKDSAVTMEKISFTPEVFMGNFLVDDVGDLLKFKSDTSTLKKSTNLLNLSDENFRKNHFVSPTTGTLNASDSYDTSGFMPVTPGKKIIKTNMVTGSRVKRTMRFIASFDNNFDIMPTSGSSVDVSDFTIPSGVAYVVVSYANRSDFTEPMIAELDISDNSIPPYELYYKPYYDATVKTDKTLSTLNVAADAKAVGDAFADVNRNISPYKNPSEVKKSSTLDANIPLVITDFPEMLKTGQRFSFSAKFDTFSAEDKIEVGFMNPSYATYQSWLEITTDSVKWMLSGTNPILNNSHGLTLSKFVHVTVEVTTDTGQLKIMITTLGGSYTFTQTSDSTRFNAIGTLTAKSSTATTDVVLSGTCTQFQCDTWLIGDSYFGSGPARIGGKLMEWGYSNNVLIDGLGGLNSTQAYAEFQKLLKYGTPKTVVWYLGMNDNSTTVASHFPLVEELCDQNGIELIFNRIPLVPTRLTENNAVNNYVMASGRRYIDSYSAVGANTSGSWYAGHLNSDGVHPDPLGASALTARMITDVPEILA